MKKDLQLIKSINYLKGSQITAVWYERKLKETNQYHTVEDAVYFQTEKNKVFKIYSADEMEIKWAFGICIKEVKKWNNQRPTIDYLTEYTNNINWHKYVGNTIVNLSINWRYIEESAKVFHYSGGRDDYPQSLIIDFDNGSKLFIELAKILPNNEIELGNNILALFFDVTARDTYYNNVSLRYY